MNAATQELKLWSNKRERESYDSQADLFALIKSVDRLEKAYVRDAISAKEYQSICSNMIAKFKTLKETIRETVPDVQEFMSTYNMDCPAAVNRLLVSGMPATLEHGCGSRENNGTVVVAETVQHFITTMDSLNLKMVAMDQIHPLLNDLVQSLHKLSFLPPDFEAKVKMKEWLMIVSKMRASDELTEEQVRQLLFDLESSYNAVLKKLRSNDAQNSE